MATGDNGPYGVHVQKAVTMARRLEEGTVTVLDPHLVDQLALVTVMIHSDVESKIAQVNQYVLYHIVFENFKIHFDVLRD